MMKIDWSSLVIGFLLGACLLLIAAQAQQARDPVGQYQITSSSNSTFVTNTNTGDTWQLFGVVPTPP
jgi:YbbR domain-containing protein